MMRVHPISGLILKVVSIIARPLAQSDENTLDLFDAGSSELFSSSSPLVEPSYPDDMFLGDSSQGNELFRVSPAYLNILRCCNRSAMGVHISCIS